MSGVMYGADIAQLRETAQHLSACADRLAQVRATLTSSVAQNPWHGPDAAQFRSEWQGAHTQALMAAATRLRDASATLQRNAAAQEQASAADGGAGGAPGGAPGAAPAGASGTGGSVAIPIEGSPAEVAEWWQNLTDDDRERLLTTIPTLFGNMDGIPLEDRVLANQLTAEAQLAESGLSDAERAYLESVVEGDRSLAVYLPGSDRIVEMIGTPGADTKDVILYLPGTGANMDSFYGGSVQQVGSYLTQQDATAGTVAFVYKDGPWADWTFVGPHGNANNGYIAEIGSKVDGFMTAVTGDPSLGDVRVSGIAHSAGMSYLSASEVAGANYDNVLSLGGSYLADGWEANPGTDYAHFQYGVDAINYLNPIKDTPAESGDFTSHVYEPDTFDILGITFQNEGANHGRIAEGPTTNQNALDDMYVEIHE